MKSYLDNNFFKKYMIIEKLGRGRYSDVHKVIEYDTGNKFALKVIPKQGLS